LRVTAGAGAGGGCGGRSSSSWEISNELLGSVSELFVGDSCLYHVFEIVPEVSAQHTTHYVKTFETVQIVCNALCKEFHACFDADVCL